MNREKTEKACRYVTTVLDGVILAANAGDGALVSRRIEDLLLAVADIQTMYAFETEMASSATATRRLTGEQAAAVVKVAGGLSLEDRKRIRRMGLSLDYVGVSNAGDLLDMQLAKKAKGGS